jgi:hypothetical protein
MEVLLFLKILMTNQFLIPQLYMCRWGDRRGLNFFFFQYWPSCLTEAYGRPGKYWSAYEGYLLSIFSL